MPPGMRVNFSFSPLPSRGSDDPEGQKKLAGGDRGTKEPPVDQRFNTAPALTTGTTVKVRVTSVNDAGESAPSAEVSAVVP